MYRVYEGIPGAGEMTVSVVKNAYCTSRGLEFNSPTSSGSHLSVSPAPGDLLPLASEGTCTHEHIPTHRHTSFFFKAFLAEMWSLCIL